MAVGTPAYMSPEQASGRAGAGRPHRHLLRSARCSTRCWPASRRSPAPTAQAMIVKRLHRAGAERAERRGRACRRRWTRRSGRRWRRWRRTGSPPRRSSRRRSLACTPRDPAPRRAVLGTAPTARAARRSRRRSRVRSPRSRSGSASSSASACCSPGAGHAPASAGAGGERRVAVLPFENLGDSADAYFADGVTDAVRGKLTALPGLRGHRAQQLGAVPRHHQDARRRSAASWACDYLLIGKVRWAEGADGASRVQVSPELIEVGDGARAGGSSRSTRRSPTCSRCRRTSPGSVAQALDVALGSRQQRGARGAAHREPRGVRRLPERRGRSRRVGTATR